jgi:hypothetical protein
MFVPNYMADRMERENYVLTRSPQPSTSGIIVPSTSGIIASKTITPFTLPPSSFPFSFQIQTTLGVSYMYLTNSSETSAVYNYVLQLLIYNSTQSSTINNYSSTPNIPATISTANGGIAKLVSTFAKCQIFEYDGVNGCSMLYSAYASPQTIPALPDVDFIYEPSGSASISGSDPTTYTITNQTQSVVVVITYTCLYELTPSIVSSASPMRLRA